MLPELAPGAQAVLPMLPHHALQEVHAPLAFPRPQLKAAATVLQPGMQAPPPPPFFAADPFGAPGGGADLEAANLEALLRELEPQVGADEVRISLKLYGAHPDQLPHTLRVDLLSALALPNTAVQVGLGFDGQSGRVSGRVTGCVRGR